MPNHYAAKTLQRLRNEIPIAILIADILQIPCKTTEGYFRFLCPNCGGFDTATNPETNLARCFACKQNFNPIDITMIVNRQNFREAVQFLQGIHKVDAKELCANIANSLDANRQVI
jgi:predicted RNA-binding Zn-ribbon protein involved in translation (DUF1610 family)